MKSKSRKKLAVALGLAGLVVVSGSYLAQAEGRIEVFSAEGCACCHEWIAHIEKSGYEVDSKVIDYDALDAIKTKAGLAPDQTSCHTAFLDGYLIEGHVPAREIDRLLKERPDAKGLAAPGMPVSAPGMNAGDEPYDVLLIHKDGSTEIYAHYR
ncbi:DUF411 domain-containing protein [Consotaella aegiceratis]|uniref:DUF411 domain-containing protein n=1 Tax=Consotaella aegiceratis TaxID=3097961 RepID=UPI002F410098